MNPLPIPAPDPLPLPAPLWLLQCLLVFTFILHTIPMNLVMGGSVLVVWSASRKTPAHGELARQLVRMLPAATALTITLGVAPLLFLQVIYGQFFYTSSILIAAPWFLIVPLLIAAYYGFYYNYFAQGPLTGKNIAVAIASALMVLVIGFLYTHNLTLMLTPEQWRKFSPSASTLGASLNWAEPTLISRYLHFLVAALAVTGLFIALRGSFLKDMAQSRWQVRVGAILFVAFTFLNLAVGLWFLLSQPPPVRQLFLGANISHTVHLWAGVGLALAAMLTAVVSINAARPRGFLWITAGLLLLTISLMATVRHFVRMAYLSPHLELASVPVRPMWDVFAVFVVLLLLGIGIVGWMLKKALAAPSPATTS